MTLAEFPRSADFPDRMNPFLVKELRQGLRTRLFEGVFLGAHAIIVLVIGLEAINAGFSRGNFSRGQGFQWAAEMLFLCLLLPVRAFASVRDELNAQSVDLLRVANVDAGRVINGKWQSQMLLVTILLVSFAPYHLLRYYIGRIEPVAEFTGLVVCWCGAALATAFFLFFATLGIGGRIAWIFLGFPFGLWALGAMVDSLARSTSPADRVVMLYCIGGVFWFGGLMFFLTLAVSGFEERARMKRMLD